MPSPTYNFFQIIKHLKVTTQLLDGSTNISFKLLIQVLRSGVRMSSPGKIFQNHAYKDHFTPYF